MGMISQSDGELPRARNELRYKMDKHCCKTNPAVALLERFFYWWGCSVASHPWRVISATLAFTAICSLGMSFQWCRKFHVIDAK